MKAVVEDKYVGAFDNARWCRHGVWVKAELLLRERQVLAEMAFVEIVIWRVPRRVRASGHDFKYSLALVAEGTCVLRYDNEADKGDHKHVAGREVAYQFIDLITLQADFWNDVEAWRAGR